MGSSASGHMLRQEVVASTHPLGDLSDVLSVLPAGEHVGEGEGLQAGVDQVRFGGLLFILFYGDKTQQSSDFKTHQSLTI